MEAALQQMLQGRKNWLWDFAGPCDPVPALTLVRLTQLCILPALHTIR